MSVLTTNGQDRHDDGLPPSFICVICQQTINPDRWHWQKYHRPPICSYCSNHGGHQVRVSGMTRGDHRQLQRLVAVASALGANFGRHYGRYY